MTRDIHIPLQLPTEEAAEQWEVAMQGTRDLLEHKMRLEREAAALAAQMAERDAALAASAAAAAAEERAAAAAAAVAAAAVAAAATAAAAAAVSLHRDRERAALKQADATAAAHKDVMSRVASMQQQLRLLEQASHARVLQQQRLKMELEEVDQKTQAVLELQQQQHHQQQLQLASSQQPSPTVTAPPDAASTSLHRPLDPTVQADASRVDSSRVDASRVDADESSLDLTDNVLSARVNAVLDKASGALCPA